MGLPIFGVFLSLLGDLLADSFLSAYQKFTNKYVIVRAAGGEGRKGGRNEGREEGMKEGQTQTACDCE